MPPVSTDRIRPKPWNHNLPITTLMVGPINRERGAAMTEKKKLLGVLSAVVVGAGTVAAASSAQATVGVPDSLVASVKTADAFEAAIATGNEAELRAFLQNHPTSELTLQALDKLLVLVGNGHGNDSRGDNGMHGINNANQHGRQSPNSANPENANERALDPSIY